MLIALLSSASIAAAANVSPSNISGSPGATVVQSINIDQAVTNMTSWGLDINFDTTVLEYNSVDNTGTHVSPNGGKWDGKNIRCPHWRLQYRRIIDRIRGHLDEQ